MSQTPVHNAPAAKSRLPIEVVCQSWEGHYSVSLISTADSLAVEISLSLAQLNLLISELIDAKNALAMLEATASRSRRVARLAEPDDAAPGHELHPAAT